MTYKTLDILLKGIEIIPETIERRALTLEEQREYDENEHIYLEESIKDGLTNLQLINQRKEQLIALYDNSVLKGYSRVVDEQFEIDRERICAVCFCSYPYDQPDEIRLTWAIRHLGLIPETQFSAICRHASDLQGEEAQKFYYRLRRDFLDKLEYVNSEYESLKKEPPLKPFLDKDPDEMTKEEEFEDEIQFELRENKRNLAGTLYNTNIRYQLMIFLIKENLNKNR